MNHYMDRCCFILTTNYPDQARTDFEKIRDRLQWVTMDPPPAKERLRRLKEVLEAEGVSYTEGAARQLAEDNPPMRALLHKAEGLASEHDGELRPEIDVPETVVETVTAVAKLEEDESVDVVSQTQLMDELGLGKSSTSNRVHNAKDHGLIDNANRGSGTSDDWYVTDRGRQLLQEGA